MIVVTGASGQLGRAVVDRLLGRLPASSVFASVRHPRKATALADRGVDVRAGDFAEAATLAQAFEGARQVLEVSVDRFEDEGRRLHRTAIEGARTAVRVEWRASEGTPWQLLRLAYLQAAEKALFSPMCCSPQCAGFEARFRDFRVSGPTAVALHS